MLALKDNLEAAGCAVIVAGDGDEALRYINERRPDLILLDLLMPKRDGFFVLEAVKKDRILRSIPVIVLSNLGGDTTITGALERGADDYFVKSEHMIVEVIERAKEYLTGKRIPKNDIARK